MRPANSFFMSALKHITILGGGLLGGSIALAQSNKHTFRVWSRRDAATHEALNLGLDATSDLAAAVACANLLILSVPVGAMAPLLANAIAAGLPENCLITDVGSVKHLPHETLRPIVSAAGYDFIGSHPMAGGEKGGIAQARADLFLNAACLLTNDENVAAEKCQALEEFWQSLGCRTSWCSSADHDALVARISHFPHLLACVGATVALKDPKLSVFGGGGLRDTTRVASGNPAMWAEILLENRECLLENLHESLDEMKTVMQLLESGDFPAMQCWLSRAKSRRDVLSPEKRAYQQLQPLNSTDRTDH